MKISFTEAGWEDYLWFQQNDRKRLKRINALIKDTIRNPFEGLGKPEPLKSELSGIFRDAHKIITLLFKCAVICGVYATQSSH